MIARIKLLEGYIANGVRERDALRSTQNDGIGLVVDTQYNTTDFSLL